jgi:Cytochrome C oxidase, cbb3-type, subunit III
VDRPVKPGDDSFLGFNCWSRHTRQNSTIVGEHHCRRLSISRTACLIVLLTVLASTSNGQQIGNPQKGAELVNVNCSPCHAVRQGHPRSPNDKSPTFTELATAPGMTPAALMVALTTPHVGMPIFILSRDDREDIIEYILSLK